MKKILKKCLYYLYLFQKINWYKLLKNHNKESENLVIIFPSFPGFFKDYILGASFLNDLALLKALADTEKDYAIKIGIGQNSRLKDKTIYYNLSRFYNKFDGENYAVRLQNFCKIYNASNRFFPPLEEVKYWENKIYMHHKFKDLNISHPWTLCVNDFNPPPSSDEIQFPILFKPAHSAGSIGIEKINNKEEYLEIIKSTKYKEYLLQQWIDIKRDLRLIYIGDELVVHYWRINESEEWKPTSTGRGSSVDFVNLPKQWMDFIYQEYKKLGLKTAAFDVVWENDDLSKKPLILEVSPAYMPNPKPTGKYIDLPYNEFKTSMFGKDAYFKQYINLVFGLKLKLIQTYDKGAK